MISMPGMSQESYNKIHQLDIEKVQKNIERFAQDLTEYDASNKLWLNFHVYQFNLGELEDARHLASCLGSVFVPHTAYINDYRLCQEYLTGQMKSQDLYDATTELFMDFYRPQNTDANYECQQWSQICFDHEFNLVPCCRLTTDEQLGNLFINDADDLLSAREQFPICEECIASGQSSIIINAPQPDWYNMLYTNLNRQGTRFSSKIYFNFGDGESENATASILAGYDGWVCQQIILPEGCKSVRFDPVEGMCCLVKDLRVRTESTVLQVRDHNGLQLNDIYIFRTTDPQIYFEKLPAGSRFLIVETQIITMNQIAWIKMVDEVGTLAQQREDLGRQLTEARDAYSVVSGRLVEVQDAYNVTSGRLAEVQDAYNVTSGRLAEVQDAYNVTSGRLAEVQDAYNVTSGRLAEVQDAYNVTSGRLAEVQDAYNVTSGRLAEVQDAYNVTSGRLAEVQDAYNVTSRQLVEIQNAYAEGQNSFAELQNAYAELQDAYHMISNATLWKMTKPLRAVLDFVKRLLQSN